MNFTKINRVHMGVYICTADNAVSPPAVYKFTVEVQCELFINLNEFDPKFSLNP